MSVLYAMRLNWALGQLGVDPRVINQIHRDSARAMGLQAGLTPRESAVLLFTQLPMDMQNGVNAVTLKRWISGGKVRVQLPMVAEAIQALSFHSPGLSWADSQPSKLD